MGKGEFNPTHVSELAMDFTTEELRDKRRRYAIPDGIVPGTPEYLEWMARSQVERQKLYQKRAYLKRRKITLALQKYDEQKLTTIEAALAEVDEEIKKVGLIAAEKVSTTRRASKEPTRTEFVDEVAQKYNIPYEEANRIMATLPSEQWPEAFHNTSGTWTADKAASLESIFPGILDEEDNTNE